MVPRRPGAMVPYLPHRIGRSMTLLHSHPAHTARRAGEIGPSALAAPVGLRLVVAFGLIAVLWLAVAWALGWLG